MNPPVNKKCIIVLSGGLDSTTLAYHLKTGGYELEAISFDYGQRHKRELRCAAQTAINLDFELKLFQMPGILGGSALTGQGDIPQGHYKEESMKKTVVPNRNMVMLSIAAAYALSRGVKNIAIGVHAGDHAIYPDCRKDTMELIECSIQMGNWDAQDFKILTPFIKLNKSAIVKAGNLLGVPFENTHTCYEGTKVPCGKCGSCVERAEAFAENKIDDPLIPKPKKEDANTSTKN